MLVLADQALDSVTRLLDDGNIIPIIAIVMGCLTGMCGIIFSALRGISVNRAREQTKRELAAYVAEGTLDADKAVAMINAGRMKWECGDSSGNA